MKEKTLEQTEQQKNQNQAIEDYSAPLEQVKAEIRKLEELRNRFAERLKFFETEMSALALMKSDGSAVSAEKAEKQSELLGGLYEDILKLKKEKDAAEKITMEKIAMLLDNHEFFTEILENFNPNIEH